MQGGLNEVPAHFMPGRENRSDVARARATARWGCDRVALVQREL